MLRKFIVLLLCLMLCGCTQQQGNGENTTSSTSSTTQSITEIREDTPEYMREQFVEKGYMDYLCPKSIYLSYTSHVSDVFDTDRIQIDLSLSNENGNSPIHLIYNLDSNSHTFDFNNYKFNYLTNGNLRTVTADFHIEFTEFLKSVVYQVFEITILTQDNITIKVSYDIDKQEFYDASEGALENDVMNFNAGMKKNLLMRCERVINKLRNSFATIDTFNTQYQNHLDYEYHEILKATEANIPNLSTNSKVRFKTSLPFGSNYKTFKINFEYIPQNSLVDTQYILYHINEPFNTPSDLFTQDAFIQPLLKVTDHYGCTNGECYINDKGAIYLFYGGDGEYLGLFPLLNYKQAVKDVFGIDSTYTLETGTNEYGFYEDADMGVIITASYDGDGPTIPYGLYVTDSKEENGILTLTYKKYDLEEYIGDQYCPSIDACDHPASYYEEHYRDIVLTHPTWTATLKYNPEKDLYQILSVSKE